MGSGTTPTPGRAGLGGDDVPRRRSPHKGWDRDEWKRRRKDPEDAIEATLRSAYAELTGEDAPLSVLARVDAIVRPVAKQRDPEIPLVINWGKLSSEYERTNALIRLWQEEMALRADAEDERDFIEFIRWLE
jgi:hypothetical protein